MLSTNFLATHQVDVHLWTEFPYTLCPQTSFSHIVSTKRADTVGEPQSMIFQ
jgi:hypothetical protein